jgi:hypothetical protein
VAAFRKAVDPSHLTDLAQPLGLSVESLSTLSIGWSAEHGAWTFPMFDHERTVVGVRLRRPDGRKFSVTGGKEGLFIPTTLSLSHRLLVAEGPTDTAALLDLGFTTVVGRPSCTGGIKLLTELVRLMPLADVVIVADADESGRRGAFNLASVLVAYVPAVRVVVPVRHKDVREFVRAGGTRAQLELAIAAAPVRRLAVHAVTVQGGTAR